MTKTRRMIAARLSQVDAVCEILDARIPLSSRNPDVEELTAGKPHLVVLNRTDQADSAATRRWRDWFRGRGCAVLEANAKGGQGTDRFPAAVRELLAEKLAAYGLELLDTPGILWPKFEDQQVGLHLAFTGAVRDEVVDVEELSCRLMAVLAERYPAALVERYKITPEPKDGGYELLQKAARKRGFLLRGGEVDTERMASILLDEFRGGKLGRFTLELPPEEENHVDL